MNVDLILTAAIDEETTVDPENFSFGYNVTLAKGYKFCILQVCLRDECNLSFGLRIAEKLKLRVLT